jgi:hypothetical protein
MEWVQVGMGKERFGITARTLKKNIENHPYLVAYTAWHALCHNDYIKDDEWYNMLEYDVQVSQNFIPTLKQYAQPGILIGYIPFTIDHPLFMGPGTELLQDAIKKVYNINVKDIIFNELARGRRLWCSTSNCCIRGRDMKDFVEWFDKLIPEFKRNPMAAHYPERSIRLWTATQNIEPMCIQNILKHEQKKSHKIEYFLH